MYAVVVRLTVKPEKADAFAAAIQANCEASLRDEPGCLRFDVITVVDSPNEYVLYEVYRDAEAFLVEHRSTPHYAAWRAAVAECIPEGGQVIIQGVPAFEQAIAG